MKVYMLVTADEYELPLIVRDTVGEIADLLGRHKADVQAAISAKRTSLRPYNGHRYRILKVDTADED